MPRLDRKQLELPPRYLAMVQQILRQHVADAEVWAYGSRVNGGSYEASDLDLVLSHPAAPDQPDTRLGALREAFSDSNLPIIVQVVDWAQIPEAFRREVEAGYVVVQRTP
ncbi:nucleotidyltransferase domain-containing protein [Pseudomonas sp. NW5]|uniref:nucleotidyltransferase domain-containing protein n=1 Tax=Pseudomonas sp. NW5 TaxID=2934934 RepID=UPI00201FBDBE|nr:nucleotidyltransferase domain-containing protein [Pseudomonas sp. NW5]MCL7461703.1 nucleotidyltransferase domain-containing protein [Pseudomonas sp. NW5]